MNPKVDFSTLNLSGLLADLVRLAPKKDLFTELDFQEDEIEYLIRNHSKLNRLPYRILHYCLKNKLIELVIQYGGVSIAPSYNIFEPFSFENKPIGFKQKINQTLLYNRPTKIGGFTVNFPIGLAASVITGTSSWVQFYAERGFDILTYKTVRTRQEREHKFPNWAFIPNPIEIKNKSDFEIAQVADPNYWPDSFQNITMANSFGVPSLSPTEWRVDVQNAKSRLKEGQVLIVSVMASTRDSVDSIAHDFAEAALLATKAGADIIELNLSCPNVYGDPVGVIYRSPDAASRVTQTVRNVLKDSGYETPVFIKIGFLEYDDLLKLIDTTSSYINGIVAINTISVPVVDKNNNVFFPDDEEKGIPRHTAGLSGSAIRRLAKGVIRNLVEIRAQKQLPDFNILAVGGVMNSSDVEDYLEIGADGVLSVTGAMVNPNMAIEIRQDHRLARDITITTTIGEKVETELEVAMKKNNKPESSDKLKKLEEGVYSFEDDIDTVSDEFIDDVLRDGLDEDLQELIRLTKDVRSGKLTITEARKAARKHYQTA